MNKVTSPVHLLGNFHDCADTTLFKPPAISKRWFRAGVCLFGSCKLSDVIEVNHPRDAGLDPPVRDFPYCLHLVWVCCPLDGRCLFLWGGPCASPLSTSGCHLLLRKFMWKLYGYLLFCTLAHVYSVHSVLAHVNSETFSVSYMISQRIPEWLRRFNIYP